MNLNIKINALVNKPLHILEKILKNNFLSCEKITNF